MNTRRWAVALVLFAIIVPAAPAGAPPKIVWSCDPGEICVWDDKSHSGCFVGMPVPSIDASYGDGQPGWENCGGVIDDKISSYWHRGDKMVVFYTRDGYLGASLCLWPGVKRKSIEWSRMDNTFSSHNNEIPEDEAPPHPYPGRPSFPQSPDGCTIRHAPSG